MRNQRSRKALLTTEKEERAMGGAGDHGGEHGAAKGVQQAGGHGQAQYVVAKGPAQILANIAHGGAGKGQGREYGLHARRA